MPNILAFARRHNRDASIDSICTRCYQTIARERNEADLASAERHHACDLNAESDAREEISHHNHSNGAKR